jgi:monoamine oxidase
VIGGGLAGLIAGRELAGGGTDVLVLEARGRVGGRIWTDTRLDTQLEMGAMGIHWIQPFIWSEVQRYGLELDSPPELEEATWYAGGERYEGTFDDFCAKLDGPLNQVVADSREVFPHPYATATERAAVEALDGLGMADRLDKLDLTPEERGLLHAFCEMQFHGPTEEGAVSQLLRWVALAAGDWQLLFEALAGYEFANGTRDLVDAVVADGEFEVALESPVAGVSEVDGRMEVSLRDGGTVVARAVIVAVPINVLGDIDFSPALPAGVREVAAEKQVSRGLKMWAEISGGLGPWFAWADDHPLTFAARASTDGERSLLLCFGSDAERLDPNDLAGAQAALEPLLPGVEVLRCAGHNWLHDEFTQGTWAMLRPGQWTKLRDLDQLKGPLFIAGSDFAEGWAGLMDGAIESGMVAARRARRFLAADGSR